MRHAVISYNQAMAGNASTDRIMHLREQLDAANRAYYVDADSIMSDRDYDALMRELIDLEAANPHLDDPTSPSHRVGGEPIEGFETVDHVVPMQSVDNTYSIEDLEAWLERVRRGLGLNDDHSGPMLACDPKIDGVAISLRYEDGVLVRAVTRGDGQRGDDVTAQVRAIRAIPLRLSGAAPAVLGIRGEIFMDNAVFESLNERRRTSGEALYANARNVTAGTLKSLDPGVVADRQLRFSAHGLGECDGWDGGGAYSTYVAALREFGVPVSGELQLVRNLSELVDAVHGFGARRAELGFGVDGMVVRVDSFAHQETLGATSKAPRWCVAFNYPADQGVTTLLEVAWQVGKGGTLTHGPPWSRFIWPAPPFSMRRCTTSRRSIARTSESVIESWSRRRGRSFRRSWP